MLLVNSLILAGVSTKVNIHISRNDLSDKEINLVLTLCRSHHFPIFYNFGGYDIILYFRPTHNAISDWHHILFVLNRWQHYFWNANGVLLVISLILYY